MTFAYQYNTGTYTIPASDLAGYFTLTPVSPPTQCHFNDSKLVQSDYTTPFTNVLIAQSSPIVSAMKSITVDSSQNSPQIVFWLKYLTNGMQYAVLNIVIDICGGETLTCTNNQTILQQNLGGTPYLWDTSTPVG